MIFALAATARADTWTTETFTLAPDDYVAASLAQGASPSAFPSGVGTLDEPAVSSGLLLAGQIRDYYDQAHLITELRGFTGLSPTRFLAAPMADRALRHGAIPRARAEAV